MKKKTNEWYRKKCVDIAKKKAKERDDYICQKCLKKVEGANAHGSHIYNEGRYRNLATDPRNILCLCYFCHINWWHKAPLEASEWFNNKYPELAEELRIKSQKIEKINFEEMYKNLK